MPIALLIAILQQSPNLIPIGVALINMIKGQTGKTLDQMIADTDIIIDEGDKLRLEDLKRLGVI